MGINIEILLQNRKKKLFKILGIILSILLIIINAGLIFVYYKSNSFFDKITNVEYETYN